MVGTRSRIEALSDRRHWGLGVPREVADEECVERVRAVRPAINDDTPYESVTHKTIVQSEIMFPNRTQCRRVNGRRSDDGTGSFTGIIGLNTSSTERHKAMWEEGDDGQE